MFKFHHSLDFILLIFFFFIVCMICYIHSMLGRTVILTKLFLGENMPLIYSVVSFGSQDINVLYQNHVVGRCVTSVFKTGLPGWGKKVWKWTFLQFREFKNFPKEVAVNRLLRNIFLWIAISSYMIRNNTFDKISKHNICTKFLNSRWLLVVIKEGLEIVESQGSQWIVRELWNWYWVAIL